MLILFVACVSTKTIGYAAQALAKISANYIFRGTVDAHQAHCREQVKETPRPFRPQFSSCSHLEPRLRAYSSARTLRPISEHGDPDQNERDSRRRVPGPLIPLS